MAGGGGGGCGGGNCSSWISRFCFGLLVDPPSPTPPPPTSNTQVDGGVKEKGGDSHTPAQHDAHLSWALSVDAVLQYCRVYFDLVSSADKQVSSRHLLSLFQLFSTPLTV